MTGGLPYAWGFLIASDIPPAVWESLATHPWPQVTPAPQVSETAGHSGTIACETNTFRPQSSPLFYPRLRVIRGGKA